MYNRLTTGQKAGILLGSVGAIALICAGVAWGGGSNSAEVTVGVFGGVFALGSIKEIFSSLNRSIGSLFGRSEGNKERQKAVRNPGRNSSTDQTSSSDQVYNDNGYAYAYNGMSITEVFSILYPLEYAFRDEDEDKDVYEHQGFLKELDWSSRNLVDNDFSEF